MKIIRIYLYDYEDFHVLVLARDEAEEQKIKDAAEEFSRLDAIYARHEGDNPNYKKAVEIVENGFGLFLEGRGFILPNVETISLRGGLL